MSLVRDSMVVVVMGVAGSGKTEVARALAARFSLDYVEGDAFHPASNVAKMKTGQALVDDDRWEWLDALSREAGQHRDGCVISCSALRAVYRDRLRARINPLVFVFLDAPAPVVAARVCSRPGHFMPASLVDSQLATLERPDAERDVITIDATLPLSAVVVAAETALSARLRLPGAHR
ncbi:MAG: gluconokinase, GntK/IdnK-type [Burkholderiaceae bacterium]